MKKGMKKTLYAIVALCAVLMAAAALLGLSTALIVIPGFVGIGALWGLLALRYPQDTCLACGRLFVEPETEEARKGAYRCPACGKRSTWRIDHYPLTHRPPYF